MSFRAITLPLLCAVGVGWSAPAHAQITVPEVQPSSAFPLSVGAVDPVETTYPADLTLLKPGDRIQITVVGFPELSGEQTVLADGSVQVPMAGNVGVWGLTLMQVTDRVAQSLLPYVRRPQVGVTLISVRPARISVTGEVRRPGIHQVVQPDIAGSEQAAENDNVESFQTVSYALALAGGVTPYADLRNITIRRAEPTFVGIGNREQTSQTEIKVNLWEAIQDGNLSSDIRVYDGDEIIVPIATTVHNVEQQALLNSTIAPTTINVQVAGEVRAPGSVQIRAADGINAAIAAAGGPTDAADIDPVYLLRMTPDGQVIREEYDFAEEDSGPLQEGDVVVVKRSGIRNVLDFIGRLGMPFNILNLFLN